MNDRETVIKDLEECLSASCRGFRPRLSCPYNDEEWDIMRDALDLLKEQDAVVRCKDCKHRGDRHKCIVAFVAEKQEMPYFFYDNRGEWFCADGERRTDNGKSL